METVVDQSQPVQQLARKALSKSMNKIVPAGGISKRAVEMNQQDREALLRIRTYQADDDVNRDIEYKDAKNRIDQGYKRVYNENSWNEQKRLAPKYQVYHHLNNKFRKSPRDLQMVKSQEREDKFQMEKNHALTSKQESRERYTARQLERKLVQSKAEQPLSDSSKLEVATLEATDPNLAVELLQKKKWRNVQKDPTRILKDQFIDTTSYWIYLNNLPRKSVGNIVTDYVVKVDKQGCERILTKIFDQKQSEEDKRNKQQQERSQLRHKLKQRHNNFLMLEKACGVRLGSLNPAKAEREPHIPSNFIETFSDANLEPLIEDQSKLDLSKEISTIQAGTPQCPSFKGTIPSKMATLRSTIPEEPQVADEQFHFKFSPSRGPSRDHPRENILAMPKPEYQGQDFFQRSEFRGLILADYQEAIGKKAFQCVEDINKSTVSQFSQLKSFQDSINQKKQIQSFYYQSRLDSQRTKRPQLEQSQLTNFQKSHQQMNSPLNITIGNPIPIQQRIQEMQNKNRAVTAALNMNGIKDQRAKSFARHAYTSSIEAEGGLRPKTTINSAFYVSDQEEKLDRVFKIDPVRLQTVDERLSYWPRTTKTAHAQRQTTATSMDEEVSNLNEDLKDFENRVACENGNPLRAVCRYPNVRLQQALKSKTSQSTRSKITPKLNLMI